MNRAWDILAAVLIVAHLVAQAIGAQVLADSTQVLLMPALAGAVWNRPEVPRGTRSARLYAGALFFSWAGDAAPRILGDDAGFIAMVTAFGIAQACFVATFHHLRRTRLHPMVIVGYIAGFAALFAACASGAGSLLPLVAVYGVVLVAAAASATRVNLLVGVGGLVFFASDSLIGLEAFAIWYRAPAHDLLVMTSYIAAQVLIAMGMLREWRADSIEAGAMASDPTGSAQAGDGSVEQSA
ncbi:lysoplasmalogenase [Ruania alba]|uniref:YhhN-like protein n=1 Tax=Ruania alba TaxID=648782 RepID=A0A1H5FIZ0_9MICO|nr:lysoplasmalogenase [Ruania alba]SEE03355.1 YhhN-like protein [Ruania alba]